MITLEHLQIYKSYNGDGDGFVRCATDEEKTVMDYLHWSLIETLIQDIRFIKKGLASEIYAIGVDEKLQKNCDNEDTIQRLKEIANR